MGRLEPLRCNRPPAPPPLVPPSPRAGGSEPPDCPKLRVGKLRWPLCSRLTRDLDGGPRLHGPVAAPCPPHPRPTLGARGSGGQEGEEEPPAAPGRQLHGAHCGSVPMAPARPGGEGAGRARGGGRALAPERAPSAGAAGGLGGSSRLCGHDGEESQLHNFIPVLPQGSPPPPPPPPPVIGSQRARSSSPPPPPPTAFQQVPGSGNSQLHFLPLSAQAWVALLPARGLQGCPQQFSPVSMENPPKQRRVMAPLPRESGANALACHS